MNSVALCAGVGMLDEGCAAAFEYLGIDHTVAAYVEREAFAAAQLVALMEAGVLAPALVWSDLTTFDARSWRGKVDCITGGFPCQPHSVAGKREGVEDERWIWDDIERIIRDTGAWCVVFENVRGLLSSGGMGPVLASLSSLGFTVEWTVISAGEVGASHRRERVIIVAYAEHDARSAQWRVGQGRRGNKSPHYAAGAGRPGEIVLADSPGGGFGELRQPPGRDGQLDGCHKELAHPDGHELRADSRGSDRGADGRHDAAGGGQEVANTGHQPRRQEQQITVCWRCAAPDDCLCGEGLADASRSGRPSAGELRAGRGQSDLSGTSGAVDDAGRAEWRPDALTRSGRGEGSDGEREAPSRVGISVQVLGDPENANGRSQFELGSTRRGRCGPAGGSGDVAHTDGIGQRREGDGGDSARRVDRGCGELAVSNDAGLSRGGGASLDAQRWEKPDGHARLEGRELFAPGPADPRWGRYIRASRIGTWERAIANDEAGSCPWAPATKPGVRMLVDGMALVVDESRRDQLRAVGNGVVPLQAAAAIVGLIRRLMV